MDDLRSRHRLDRLELFQQVQRVQPNLNRQHIPDVPEALDLSSCKDNVPASRGGRDAIEGGGIVVEGKPRGKGGAGGSEGGVEDAEAVWGDEGRTGEAEGEGVVGVDEDTSRGGQTDGRGDRAVVGQLGCDGGVDKGRGGCDDDEGEDGGSISGRRAREWSS
jgi:hypothetical protein